MQPTKLTLEVQQHLGEAGFARWRVFDGRVKRGMSVTDTGGPITDQ